MSVENNLRRLLIGLIASVCSVNGCAASAVFAQTLSNASFEQLLSSIQDELDRRYTAAKNSEELFSGVTAAVGLVDGCVAAFSAGCSDIEKQVAMSPAVRMPSGSIGNTFVAAGR